MAKQKIVKRQAYAATSQSISTFLSVTQLINKLLHSNWVNYCDRQFMAAKSRQFSNNIDPFFEVFLRSFVQSEQYQQT